MNFVDIICQSSVSFIITQALPYCYPYYHLYGSTHFLFNTPLAGYACVPYAHAWLLMG